MIVIELQKQEPKWKVCEEAPCRSKGWKVSDGTHTAASFWEDQDHNAEQYAREYCEKLNAQEVRDIPADKTLLIPQKAVAILCGDLAKPVEGRWNVRDGRRLYKGDDEIVILLTPQFAESLKNALNLYEKVTGKQI